MNRIASYYDRKDESQRLFTGRGELEFLRTKQIIQEYLPDGSGLSIADIGGGTGPYSFWLAESGHDVSLFDLMPHHIQQALATNRRSQYPLNRIEEADVRSLDLPGRSVDAVLLMGPMYHLTDRKERVEVLRKVAAWLADGGLGFIAYISRFGSVCDGFVRGLFEDPEFLEIARGELETGVHRPNRENTRYFTDAYLHHPDDIEEEAVAANLEIVDHVAVEGLGWLWQNFDELWADERQRSILLEMVARTDRDRSLLGVSGHILLVVKRRDIE